MVRLKRQEQLYSSAKHTVVTFWLMPYSYKKDIQDKEVGKEEKSKLAYVINKTQKKGRKGNWGGGVVVEGKTSSLDIVSYKIK